jgi:hypothetical protein
MHIVRERGRDRERLINIQILNTIDGKKEKKMKGKKSVNCWNGKLCTYSSHFDFQNNFKRAGNFFFSIL